MNLYWDSTYAVVIALIEQYPAVDPATLSLGELTDMVLTLPGFVDDTAVVTTRMLLDIQLTWYEEITPP
jgi:FeS assembly protein IscX